MRRSLVMLLVLAATAEAQQTPDAVLARRVDSIAARVLDATGRASASVAVVQHGTIVYAQAYGPARLEPSVSATPAMRYPIGSISKQFTAAVLLLLQEDGTLSLDDKVERWVPGLTRGADITLRQLLSHTSGYQDYWPQDYVPPFMEAPATPSSILARWAKRPLDFEPGARWQYSNTNYVIAALAAEKASGMPFFQLVQRRILVPLGLTSALDFDAGSPSSIEPAGYSRSGLGPFRVAKPTGPGWLYGAGQLAMTASDLARWDIALLTGTLLKPASYRELTRTMLLSNGSSAGYALGVGVGTFAGRRMIEHSGGVSGFISENIFLPDDSAAVVVLTNQDAAAAAQTIAQTIATGFFTAETMAASAHTALARRIFEGLQQGAIDRTLLTANANAYFSAQTLADFMTGLEPFGAPTAFLQINTGARGGMTFRSYRVTFPGGRALRVTTYELADGKLEQFLVMPG